MINSASNRTVVVAMSGGVDSSVAAALLLEKGYDVIGVTMKTYNFDEVGGNIGNETSCCGLDAFNDARMVAVKLGIPHYVVDFTEQFGREVIDNFVEEYLQGRTPNPCIICNKRIKWGELMRKAEALGANHIATGHYARVSLDERTHRHCILRSADKNKDQTYALWGLSQSALSKTLFPLGGLTKPEVRSIAARYGLKTASKEESYEICFVADNDYRRFLKERVPDLDSRVSDGDIVFDEAVVGKHQGFPYYTIGQRSGIGSYGERVYVTEIDAVTNTVKIGRKDNLLHRGLIARDINFIGIEKLDGDMRFHAQVRYKDTPSLATVSPEAGGRIRVVFDEPKQAITPGQSVVIYDGDSLVGGGVIERVDD
ncbi:MAG: tRNA 2-thiouridine(34) synthase MnmA [Ignavibacteria bacterium]|nr:tRNA 2-thiouridine(34) synthase MnmA [Ignavibacteria bacterium]MBI3765793.1 tRNA 2-thiouridine(34) synthase MnmA [Ignavibacteriales bacterium]